MRKILFRAMDKWTRVWYYWNEYGDLCSESGKIKRVEVLNSRGVNSYYYSVSSIKHRIEKESMSQYTGMHDKNGKRIFEGDILRHSYWHGNEKKSRNICVRFLNGAFCWSTSADNDENCFAFADSEMYGINTGKDCEVIGNIFDNKELLKKEI